jgi:hypothetical protein
VIVELLPGVGVRLAGTPDLLFGLGEDELAARVPAARAGRVIHTTWARIVEVPGVEIAACGGAGRRLDSFEIEPTDEAGGVPVVYADVDVFGWPADEVIEYLVAEGHRMVSGPRLTRVDVDLILFRDGGPRFGTLLFRSPDAEPLR